MDLDLIRSHLVCCYRDNMTNNDHFEYSPDGKFVTLDGSHRNDETDLTIPVNLLDELIERRVSIRDLDILLLARYQTAGRGTQTVLMSDLLGQDLSNKTIGIIHFGQDDYHPEWMWSYSDAVTTVVKNGYYYNFSFPEEAPACGSQNCDNLSSLDAQNHICGKMKFPPSEHVTVTEKGSVQV